MKFVQFDSNFVIEVTTVQGLEIVLFFFKEKSCFGFFGPKQSQIMFFHVLHLLSRGIILSVI